MAEDQRYTSLDANARARSNVIKGPRICTDGVWAAIFLAHLALVVVLAAMHMPELFHAARTDFVEVESKHNATIDPELQAAAGDAARRAWPFVVVGLGVSFLWSIVWIIIVQVFSESLIWFALVFTPFLFLVLTLWPGNPSPIVSGLLFLLTTFCTRGGGRGRLLSPHHAHLGEGCREPTVLANREPRSLTCSPIRQRRLVPSQTPAGSSSRSGFASNLQSSRSRRSPESSAGESPRAGLARCALRLAGGHAHARLHATHSPSRASPRWPRHRLVSSLLLCHATHSHPTPIASYPGTWIMSLLSVVPATLWQLFWLLTAGSTLYHFYQRSERFAYQDKAGMTREGVRMEPLAYLALIFLALSTYW